MSTEHSHEHQIAEEEAETQRFWNRAHGLFSGIGVSFALLILLFIVAYFVLSFVWAPLRFWSLADFPGLL